MRPECVHYSGIKNVNLPKDHVPTITGITGLTLTAGTQYFLVVGPMGLSSTTYEVWNLNNQSKTGTHLYSNDGGGTWTNAGTQTLAAFDVL